MGSFNYFKRKTLNKDLSIWIRLAALRSCIRDLSQTKKSRYLELLHFFDDKYSFDRYRDTNNEPPSDDLLIKVLEDVEAERKNIIASRRVN